MTARDTAFMLLGASIVVVVGFLGLALGGAWWTLPTAFMAGCIPVIIRGR